MVLKMRNTEDKSMLTVSKYQLPVVKLSKSLEVPVKSLAASPGQGW